MYRGAGSLGKFLQSKKQSFHCEVLRALPEKSPIANSVEIPFGESPEGQWVIAAESRWMSSHLDIGVQGRFRKQRCVCRTPHSLGTGTKTLVSLWESSEKHFRLSG